MSLLERTRQIAAPARRPAGQYRRVLTAAGYGAIGAFALALLLLVPVLAAWVTDPQGDTSWHDAMSMAPVAWVLAHRGTAGVPGNEVSVTLPLLVATGIAVLLARLAAKHALVRVDDREQEAWWQVPAAFVAGYAGGGVLLALLAWVGPSKPNPILVVPGSAIVAALGMFWALSRASEDEPAAAGVFAAAQQRIPACIRRSWRASLHGAAALLALGVLLVALMLLTGWGRMWQVSSELGAGTTGTVVLVGAQLAALPNIVAWAATWLSGAAISVGSVSVGHAAVTPGVLPMIPVLGAIPEAGAGPAWAPFTPVLPLAIGAFIGWRATSSLTTLAALTAKLGTAATGAAMTALIVLAVAFIGSVGVSGGSLAYVGPHLLALPLLTVELVIGAVGAALALHYWRTRA